MSDFCSQADAQCVAPAGYSNGRGWYPGDKQTKLTCSTCGEPVCSKCSKVKRSKKAGQLSRMRLCNTCIEHAARHGAHRR